MGRKSCLGKIFPVILLMIAVGGLTYFIINLLVPLIQARSDLKDDEAFASRFFGYGSSQTVVLDFASELNATSTAAAEQTLHLCKQALIDLSYENDGRMIIAIDDERPDDGQCFMAIKTYSDSVKELDCAIPSNLLVNWNAWKNPKGPDTSDIENHCKVINSFKLSIKPSQQ